MKTINTFSLSALSLIGLTTTQASDYANFLKQTIVSRHGLIWNSDKTLCLKLTNRWEKIHQRRLAQGKKTWERFSNQKKKKKELKGLSPACEFTHVEWSSACSNYIESNNQDIISNPTNFDLFTLENSEADFLKYCSENPSICNRNDFVFDIGDINSGGNFNIFPTGDLRCETTKTDQYKLQYNPDLNQYVLAIFAKQSNFEMDFETGAIKDVYSCLGGREDRSNSWRRPPKSWSKKKIRKQCSQANLSTTCPPGFEYNAENKTCDEIDECYNPALNNCHVDAICYNWYHGFSCKCPEGMEGDGVESCQKSKVDCPPDTVDDGTACISVGDYDWLLASRTKEPSDLSTSTTFFKINTYETHPWLFVNADSQEIIAVLTTYPGNDCKLTAVVWKDQEIKFHLSASELDDDLWLTGGSCSGTPPVFTYGAADVKNFMTKNYPVKSVTTENAMQIRFVNEVFDIEYKFDIYWIDYDGKPVFYRRISNGM